MTQNLALKSSIFMHTCTCMHIMSRFPNIHVPVYKLLCACQSGHDTYPSAHICCLILFLWNTAVIPRPGLTPSFSLPPILVALRRGTSFPGLICCIHFPDLVPVMFISQWSHHLIQLYRPKCWMNFRHHRVCETSPWDCYLQRATIKEDPHCPGWRLVRMPYNA